MTTLLPDPYPGELLSSVFARFKARFGLSTNQMVQELYGGRMANIGVRLPVQLSVLHARLPSWQHYSVQSLATQHTLVRYYTGFGGAERRQQVMQRMEGSGVGLMPLAGLTMSRFQEKGWLFLCPACVVADTQTYGEPYWHTVHQAAGVWYCPHHIATPLLQSPVTMSSRFHTATFVTPVDVPLDDCHKTWAADIEARHRVTLQTLGRLALEVLDTDVCPPTDEWESAKYLEALGERGFIYPRGMVKAEPLTDVLNQCYPPELLSKLGYSNPLTVGRRLAGLARTGRSRSHTLTHLLMLTWLGLSYQEFSSVPPKPVGIFHPFGAGPWPCKNPLQGFFCPGQIDHVSLSADGNAFTFSCPECGFVYGVAKTKTIEQHYAYDYGEKWIETLRILISDKSLSMTQIARALGVSKDTFLKVASTLNIGTRLSPPYIRGLLVRQTNKERQIVERRENYRSTYLAFRATHPEMSRSELIQECSEKVPEWLRKYDREWYEEHSPPHKKRLFSPDRFAKMWAELDTHMAVQVPQIADMLYHSGEHTGKLTRVTKHTIHPHLSSSRLTISQKKTPMTMAAISTATESTSAFQMRRLEHILRQLTQSETYITFLGVLNRASITGEYRSPQVLQAAKTLYDQYLESWHPRDKLPEIETRT